MTKWKVFYISKTGKLGYVYVNADMLLEAGQKALELYEGCILVSIWSS